MYLKSLDHMGIQAKQADKKHFAAKHLVDAIKTKHEEQRRQRSITGRAPPRYQFSYDFDDHQVITDVLRFMVLYASNSTHHNSHERRRISEFFEKFITIFFGLSSELVAESIAHIDRGTPDDEEDESAPTELPNGGRGRRQVNGKKNDLRRGVLDKGRNGVRGRVQKEGSATGSKESTPDVESLGEEESAEAAEDQAAGQVSNDRWGSPPTAMAVPGSREISEAESRLNVDQPYKRDDYTLYCNQTLYVFFSIFQALYSRLKGIKDSEHEARDAGSRAAAPKPAHDLELIPDRGADYALPSHGETYYSKALLLIEEYINGDVEDAKYTDWLRRHYLRNGWTLYTIVDLLKSLCRLGATCSSVDAKERTPDLLEQFYSNRQDPETTYNSEINMRKQADRFIKDGDLFAIHWVSFFWFEYCRFF
jgi:paired amphipathic helix protein Sin3a